MITATRAEAGASAGIIVPGEAYGAREQAVLDTVHKLEVSLLGAMFAEYGMPRCGPASIVLAHLTQQETGVPFRYGAGMSISSSG